MKGMGYRDAFVAHFLEKIEGFLFIHRDKSVSVSAGAINNILVLRVYHTVYWRKKIRPKALAIGKKIGDGIPLSQFCRKINLL